MKILLDTHFLIWTAIDAPRTKAYPWLNRYQPWGISPVSLLELQLLHEIGRIEARPDFFDAIVQDPRYILDDAPLAALMSAARDVSYTRDPFDRMLAAHSTIRRVPLCTVDRKMLAEHAIITKELRA